MKKLQENSDHPDFVRSINRYIFWTISLFFSVGFSVLYCQVPTGKEIMERVNDIMSPENSKGIVSQTIQTTSGKLRTFQFEMYTANRGEKTLMRYIKPLRVKGQAFLMLNHADDIWSYFPRTKRIRKLASHAKKQRLQGSDFTYEDLGSGDMWKDKFFATNLGEEKCGKNICWKLQLVGIDEKDPPYPKVIMWVRKMDYYPLKMDYFNERDQLIKSLVMEDIRIIDGIPTAMKMVMYNHEDNTETSMETIEITYRWAPPEDFFTERNLKK